MIESPLHPLYADDKAVGQLSKQHLDAGRSVFQLWFLKSVDEREHSLNVLEALQLPMLTDILSLGCGVGGMERYWHDARPDLTFTLLNQSLTQLDLCVCPGDKVHTLAENYCPWFAHGATLVSYMLGHVYARDVLDHALEYTTGPVIVLDVFDSSPEFNGALCYNAPTSGMMKEMGFVQMDVGPWHLNPFVAEQGLAHVVSTGSTPKLWISE